MKISKTTRLLVKAEAMRVLELLDDRAIKRVESMNIEQLVKFMGDKTECQEG